ncbi:hypothetical protein [Streptomyces niveus]|uniref:hypothetical protein n=1 Tax=Streptomyces niveus TaxID=193462 RepID=UPI00341949FD
MGRHKQNKPRRQRGEVPADGVCTTPFVMERAEWLGYITGQQQPVGYATCGEHYDTVMAAVAGFIDHLRQPDGTWLPRLDPRDGRPWQALEPDPAEPITTLHRSLTVASFLADQNFEPGSVVLHTIDGDPYLLTDTYRQQHPGENPVISRMWTDVQGVRMVPA